MATSKAGRQLVAAHPFDLIELFIFCLSYQATCAWIGLRFFALNESDLMDFAFLAYDSLLQQNHDGVTKKLDEATSCGWKPPQIER